MEELVTADIGGTHARFAIAQIAGGKVHSVSPATILETNSHDSLAKAWQAFSRLQTRALPRTASIAIACPIDGDELKFTNNPWVIRPAEINTELNLDQHVLLNDFEAIGHAVAQAADADFSYLCGPDEKLPRQGTISVVGPGTGLGVAHVYRHEKGYHVNATEGGHIGFAPGDAFEDALLLHMRGQHGRVSAERLICGPAIYPIYCVLAERAGQDAILSDHRAVWDAVSSGTDTMAQNACARLCAMLGGVTGDIALAQGAQGVVIAGGLGARLGNRLVPLGFADRFQSKGRFANHMSNIPVKRMTLEEPGLFGAAAAFARSTMDQSNH